MKDILNNGSGQKEIVYYGQAKTGKTLIYNSKVGYVPMRQQTTWTWGRLILWAVVGGAVLVSLIVG